MISNSTKRLARTLVDIDEFEKDEEWFKTLDQVEGSLTKCLLLVAVLIKHALIFEQEGTIFKKLLLENHEQAN